MIHKPLVDGRKSKQKKGLKSLRGGTTMEGSIVKNNNGVSNDVILVRWVEKSEGRR